MRIGYARVSTEEQSLDAQRERLEEAGCERIFSEKESGTRSNRPKLEEAFDHLRDGDVLVVWRLDRLGRSTKDLIAKTDRLDEIGAELDVIDQEIDTTTAQGRFFFRVMAALAEFEADLASKRTQEGIRAAKEEGRMGRPSAFTEEEIRQIQVLMRDDSVGTAEIARRFDVSTTTIYRYVSPSGERRK